MNYELKLEPNFLDDILNEDSNIYYEVGNTEFFIMENGIHPHNTITYFYDVYNNDYCEQDILNVTSSNFGSQISKGNEILLINVKKKSDDKKIAYIVLGFDMLNGIEEIEMIYVNSDYRGKRIAKDLLNIAIKIARKLKLNNIKLRTLESKVWVVNFYEKFGFERGEIVHNKPGDIGLEEFVDYSLKL